MNPGYPPRGIGVPHGGPSQRLGELLDQIRSEFETESQRSVEYESQSEYSPTREPQICVDGPSVLKATRMYGPVYAQCQNLAVMPRYSVIPMPPRLLPILLLRIAIADLPCQ